MSTDSSREEVQIFFLSSPRKLATWLPDQDRIWNLFVIICHKSVSPKHPHLPSSSSPLDYAKNNTVFCWRGEWLCTDFIPHTKSDISSSFVLLKGNEQIIQLPILWSSSTSTVKGQSGKHKLFPLCCKEWFTPRQDEQQTQEREIHSQGPDSLAKTPLEDRKEETWKYNFK